MLYGISNKFASLLVVGNGRFGLNKVQDFASGSTWAHRE